MTFPSRVRRYILYNALVIPVIYAVYLPYMFLWIGLTLPQLIAWFVGGLPFMLVANLVITPWVIRVAKWVEKK